MGKNKKRNKFLKRWNFIAVLVILATIYIDNIIDRHFICLDYLYHGIKFFVLVLLLIICHFTIKKSFIISVTASFFFWTIFNVISYWSIQIYAKENGNYITTQCQVLRYYKRSSGGTTRGLIYLFNGHKQNLHYCSSQLDSLKDSNDIDPWGKVELTLKLNKICNSIYYINDYSIRIRD